MDYKNEVQTKLGRARQLMQDQQVGALWLRRADNFAWITGGVDSAVNTADVLGIASVVITPTEATVWTNSIEAPRLTNEDRIEDRGFKVRYSPWEATQPIELGSTLATDFPLRDAKDVGLELQKLRSHLLPVEIDRFRNLGQLCAEAMDSAISMTAPGMTEWEIASVLGGETRHLGITPIVVLIATDERISQYRHPLPTDKEMTQYAMLVLCGRKNGLVCSITRLIHFGSLPAVLREKMHACAEVDARMIAASMPGVTLGEMFKITQDAYARVGYDGEWKLHHQGGTAAYSPRELLAVPGESFALAPGMACAWNPSITGVKSEDTILVPEAGGTPEVLTAVDGWPVEEIEVNGTVFERPLIVEME
ncbi:MAG: aminopeptidase P family protein [Chloroflexi bacterium]|nr:aminopeptidase P family protein [Chloroflexota bacterium]